MALGSEIDQVSDLSIIITQCTKTENIIISYLQGHRSTKTNVPASPIDLKSLLTPIRPYALYLQNDLSHYPLSRISNSQQDLRSLD